MLDTVPPIQIGGGGTDIDNDCKGAPVTVARYSTCVSMKYSCDARKSADVKVELLILSMNLIGCFPSSSNIAINVVKLRQ
jgi:hypothetical protein